MAFKTITMRLVVCSVALACTGLMAQTGKDLGKREYDNNCASCHGLDGKGHGVFVEWLKRSPPDLTSLSRRNAGVFPMANVYDVVEGAGPGHGSREMPVWGRDYSGAATTASRPPSTTWTCPTARKATCAPASWRCANTSTACRHVEEVDYRTPGPPRGWWSRHSSTRL